MEYIRSPAPPPTPAVLAKARDDSPRRERCYVGFISYSLLLFPEQPVLVSHVCLRTVRRQSVDTSRIKYVNSLHSQPHRPEYLPQDPTGV